MFRHIHGVLNEIYLQPICVKIFVNRLHLVLQISKIFSQKNFALQLYRATVVSASYLFLPAVRGHRCRDLGAGTITAAMRESLAFCWPLYLDDCSINYDLGEGLCKWGPSLPVNPVNAKKKVTSNVETYAWSTKWSLFIKLFVWMGCKSRDESNEPT